MLTIFGRGGGGFCDGMLRRGFCAWAALALGGLSLADALRSEAR